MGSIIISGTGGQGIRFMGNALARLLIANGYEVSALYDYDAAIRGGGIRAFISYQKQRIGNPVVGTSDIVLMLARSKSDIFGIETIADSSLAIEMPGCKKIDFKGAAEKTFSGSSMLNMVALGFLIKKLGLKHGRDLLKEAMPDKSFEENQRAIEAGFALYCKE